MNLKRSDRQYIEVEEFADYELTQCIAYEMAFRNPVNIKAIEHAIQFYVHNKEIVQSYYAEQKKIKKDPVTGHLIGPLGSFYVPISLDSCFLLLDIIDLDSSNIFMDKRLSKDFLELLALEQNRRNRSSSEKSLKININIDEDEVNIENSIQRDGYMLISKLTAFYDAEEYTNTDLSISDIDVKSVYKTQVKINENFKRPKLNISHCYTLDTTLNVNLNRPIKEIIAFVKHAKGDLEKNKLMKSPVELLGIELNRADNLVCNDEGEKCFDPRSILSKQEKMADMFYVYDCLKLGYSQRKIQNEIYNYYSDKDIETKTMDSSTLRKYREIAFDYIERGKYKELLTGIKEMELKKGMWPYDDEIE